MARKRKDSPGSIIPLDVVESILAKLPVKSLFRFKAVSYLWNGIISNSYFMKLQSEASSSSPSRFVISEFPQHTAGGCRTFTLLKFKDQSLQREAVLKVPFKQGTMLCSCNGIILLMQNYKSRTYVLWNPCTGMHVKIQWWLGGMPMAHGLCHDPTTDDYKVVIITKRRSTYSIFSCKKKTWTQRNQEFPYNKLLHSRGVCVNGSFYWIGHEYGGSGHNREILFFDGAHDKFGKLELPGPVAENLHLTGFLVNVRDRLGFIFNCRNNTGSRLTIQICILENNGDLNSFQRIITVDRWTDDLHCRKHVNCPIRSPCSVNNNKVVVFVDCSRFVIYDACEEKVIGKIENCPGNWALDLYQCRDHLFFPMQNIRIQPKRKCRTSTQYV